MFEFENLVISDKCKTDFKAEPPAEPFENLVISDKCKTLNWWEQLTA